MCSPAPEGGPSAAPLSPSSVDRAVYLFAFVDAARLDDPTRLAERDGELSLHRVGAIGAMIREVPVAEFGGAVGERNLADPVWIMPRIRHHEAVVESAMEWSPVFPARFATLYVSLGSLTEFMRRHEAVIADFLRHVAGRQEWALKVTAELDTPTALDELALELRPDWLADPPGTRYLRLRQERPRLLQVAGERAARLIPDVVEGLRPLVTEIRPLVRATAPLGARGQHVEDYALLTCSGQRAALQDRLGELAVEWEPWRLHFALSGPWPPYSFRPRLEGRCRQQDE